VNKARSTAVPAAIYPNGSTSSDSWEIASKCNLTPIHPTLRHILDNELGQLSRQLAYYQIFKPCNSNVYYELLTDGTSWLWKIMFYLYFGSYLRSFISSTLNFKDPSVRIICKEKLEKVISKLDFLVTTKKTEFLNGDSIGVADIALASLFAPLVYPDEYCCGKYTRILEKIQVSCDVFVVNIVVCSFSHSLQNNITI
jgi:hypothetical protein